MGAGAFGLCPAGDISVQEQVAALIHLHASRPDIFLRTILLAHGLQLGLHSAGGDQADTQADQHRNDQRAAGFKGFLGQVAAVIGRPLPRLDHELLTLGSKGLKSIGIIPVAEIRQEAIGDIVDAVVREGVDAKTGSADPPIPVLHAHQQQNAVPVSAVAIAIVVKIVIGVGSGGLPTQSIRGNDDHIELQPAADLIQRIQKRRFLIALQKISMIHQSGVALRREGRYCQAQSQQQYTQKDTRLLHSAHLLTTATAGS